MSISSTINFRAIEKLTKSLFPIEEIIVEYSPNAICFKIVSKSIGKLCIKLISAGEQLKPKFSDFFLVLGKPNKKKK